MSLQQKKLNTLVNQHVNHWFHFRRIDEVSPAMTLKQCNELFLQKIQRMGLGLFCEERFFRRAMCEAVCTIYVSEKEGTDWCGPYSEAPRPADWTYRKEQRWREYRDYKYLNSDFWSRFWENIEEAIWESAIPSWRTSYQSIATHYINFEDDMGIEDESAAEHYNASDDIVPATGIATDNKKKYESD
jgi:hypothetical protein